jgi:hypothetical protein
MALGDLTPDTTPPADTGSIIDQALALLKQRATASVNMPDVVKNLGLGAYNDLDKVLKTLKDYTWSQFNKLPNENLQIKPTVAPEVQQSIIQSSPLIAATLGKIPTKIQPAAPVDMGDTVRQALQIMRDSNPVTRIGSSLGESAFGALTAGQTPIGTTSTGIGIADIPKYVKAMTDKGAPVMDAIRVVLKNTNYPKITEQKTLGDAFVKPTMKFALDTAADPLTWVGGAGELGLAGIKAAAGPGAELGKQIFGAFGEAYPRIAQMATEALQKIPMFKNADPGAVYNALRSPSELLSPEFQDVVIKFKNKINLFTNTALERAKPWYALKDPDLQTKIGEAVYSGDYAPLQKHVEDLVAAGSPVVAKLPDPVNDVLDIAKGFRSLQTVAGKAAVDAGLVSKETFEANKKNYVRQFYRYFVDHPEFMNENPENGLQRMVSGINISGENKKVNFNLFNKKLAPEDFPSLAEYEEFKKNYGALGPDNVGFSATRGAILTNNAARQRQMFSGIADIPGLAKDQLPESFLSKITAGQTLADKAAVAEAGARKIKLGDFGQTPLLNIDGVEHIKIPADKGFGALAGKWMPRPEGESVVNVFKRKGDIQRAIDKFTGFWKTMKVPYSTTAQSRNFLWSNPFLMTLSGIDPVEAFTIGPKAMASFSEKGFNTPVGQAYLRLGGLGKTFVSADITPLMKNAAEKTKPSSALWQGIKEKLALPGKAYSSLESAGKMGIMDYWHGKGLTWKESFDKAQETLFDYGDRSALIDKISRNALGIPFMTFSSKALPFVAKKTLSNPGRVLSAIAMKDVMNEHQSQKLGLTPADLKLIQQRYGDWYLITGGTKDKPEVLDLSYLIPGTDLTGGYDNKGSLRNVAPFPIPQAFNPSSPYYSLGETVFNKSLYFDKPIMQPTSIDTKDIGKYIQIMKDRAPAGTVSVKDIPALLKEMVKRGAAPEKALAVLIKNSNPVYTANAAKVVIGNTKRADQLLYLLRSLGPASGFMPGSYQWDNLASALKGVPSYSGRTMSVAQALTQELGGLKFNQMDLPQSRSIALNQKRGEIKDIIKKIIQAQKSSDPNKGAQIEMRKGQLIEKAKEIRDMVGNR